ncbi:MAG: hypothetical protein M1429_02585 [Patescibacteria group bacterium]|nr:hypothetical protein [Patescibacteria group bacterium]
MNKLQQILMAIYRMLRGFYESTELKPLISTVPDGVVIVNTMDSEPEATVIASWIDFHEIPKYLRIIPAGDAGKREIMCDDFRFLPFVGRMIVRLAHSAGDQVFLPPRDGCQEAVIVVNNYAIRLVPGEKRKLKHMEPFDKEEFEERMAVVTG